MKKVSVTANTNIALVKYWGKKDDKLKLPLNNSISLTLSGLNTVTEIQEAESDEIFLNNEVAKEAEKEKLLSYVQFIRDYFGQPQKRFKIKTINNFPIAAGLASSASGFAALATALVEIISPGMSKEGISRLARIGSGSACRSVYGGFSEWLKGEKNDGSDSFAVPIVPENYWDVRMIVAVVDQTKKNKSSTAGMSETVKTCPFYQAWLDTVDNDLREVREGIMAKDLEKVGLAMERNCLKMHATMFTTLPAIIYWKPETLQIINLVYELRNDGVPCYFTIDAGPNVKIFTLPDFSDQIQERLKNIYAVEKLMISNPGSDPKVNIE